MLSFRLIHLIENHADEIANRIVQQIRRDSRLYEMGRLTEGDLRDRAHDILTNLGTWLVSSEDEIAERYERLGMRRHNEGIPLHEVVHALHIIKETAIHFAHDEGYGDNMLIVYAEDELLRGLNRIFDAMVFYVVRGYERAAEERTRTAA